MYISLKKIGVCECVCFNNLLKISIIGISDTIQFQVFQDYKNMILGIRGSKVRVFNLTESTFQAFVFFCAFSNINETIYSANHA